MNESSSWLAGLVLAEVITAQQADWVWVQLQGQAIHSKPSKIILQVGPLLVQARQLYPYD